MAFSLFKDSAAAVKYFEVRLEQSVVVLRGSTDEAASAVLRGVVIICLSQPIHVRRLSVRLQGYCAIGGPDWGTPITARPKVLREESPFFKREETFINASATKTETLQAGNYEYPFELIIPGNTPESIEGLPHSWLTYRVKASLERRLLTSSLYARHHVRIVRTLGASTLELAHEMVVQNVWAGKIDYAISVPSKAYIFGTCIPVCMKFIPLSKGLKLGEINFMLREVHDYQHHSKRFRQRRDLLSETFCVSEEPYAINDEGQDGWLIERRVRLPRTLGGCVQDTEAMGIRVRHRLYFGIKLLNAQGHTSEIFISPSLPVGSTVVSGQRPTDADVAMAIDAEQQAPPLYGDHQLDVLWSDIDANGYASPVNGLSGLNSPTQVWSRNASTENLASAEPGPQPPTSGVPAQALQSRLTTLPGAAGPNPRDAARPSLPPSSSPHNDSPERDPPRGRAALSNGDSGPPISRPVSGEGRSGSPPAMATEHIEYDTETLSKVPSYHTAMYAPTGLPLSSDLPDYEAATEATHRPSAPRLHPGAPDACLAPSSNSMLRGRTMRHA